MEPQPQPLKDPPKLPASVPRNHRLLRRLEFLESDSPMETGFQSGSQKRSGLKLALWTWFSASIDALVLVSLCCFFTVFFSYLMKATPGSVVSLFLKNQNFIHIISGLFVLSIWTYLVFMRSFMGASVGEWTCDLRLGQPVQRFEFNYLFKVMLRTTIILATGVIVLPLLSLILARDLAGDLSGIKIYSLQ